MIYKIILPHGKWKHRIFVWLGLFPTLFREDKLQKTPCARPRSFSFVNGPKKKHRQSCCRVSCSKASCGCRRIRPFDRDGARFLSCCWLRELFCSNSSRELSLRLSLEAGRRIPAAGALRELSHAQPRRRVDCHAPDRRLRGCRDSDSTR